MYNDNYEVYEDPIGLVQVPTKDAETLYTTLRDVCIRRMLPLEKCRGQAYDGASNMSGHIRGVAARVKQDQNVACALSSSFTQPLPSGCCPCLHTH